MRYSGLKQTSFDIITIGYEILDGKILDTNSKWLAEQITSLGGRVRRMITVGDDLKEIASVIRSSIKDGVDWIITSGGLGPTFDDLTLQGVAKATRRKLVLNRRALKMLEERYRILSEKKMICSPKLTPHRLKMAMLPRGAKPLRNEVGSAPGVLLKHEKTKIICLPGVPSELKNIFENEVKPLLKKSIRKVFRAEKWIECVGVAESSLAPKIDEIRSKIPQLYIKSHPRMEEGRSMIKLQLISIANNLKKAEKLLEEGEEIMIDAVKSLGGSLKEVKE